MADVYPYAGCAQREGLAYGKMKHKWFLTSMEFPPLVLRTTFPPQAVGQSQGDEVPPTLTPEVCPMAKPRPLMLLGLLRSEISPLRSATVEMTGMEGSVLSFAPTVFCLPPSSSRVGLRAICYLLSADPMTQKANPVTQTLYSSPDRAIPQPSA